MTTADETPKRIPLHALHQEYGAKFVAFAGYDMPVQYRRGVLAEHLHTRTKAGLFDVSHMGQLRLHGAGAATALERLVPSDMITLAPGRTRYTLLTNAEGGILDDLMVTNRGDHLFLVVNAGTKQADLAHISAHIGTDIAVEPMFDRALLALQGPEAAAVIGRLAPDLLRLTFMSLAEITLAGAPCIVTRSGYTGEDGFEISIPPEAAETVARTLLAQSEVEWIGLGARDSLRLEAGLCLYGHDIDTTTTPVEADLTWALQKRRRLEGGFPGAAVIQAQLAAGPSRLRVGLQPEGKAPAREHTEITDGERVIGTITSGGFGPTVGAPIAMGYVERRYAEPGTPVFLMVRGTPRPARVTRLPFTPHRYYRG